MSVTLEQAEDPSGELITITFSGRLTVDDYNQFLPRIERAIQQRGRIRLLMIMKDFHGWEPGAAWADLKFDVKHFGDIRRVAMVGDKKWEKWMASLANLFTAATVRYFDHSQEPAAESWVLS